MGVVLPPVRVRDEKRLPPTRYELRIFGSRVADGEVHPGPAARDQSGRHASAARRRDRDGSGLWTAGGVDRRGDARRGALARVTPWSMRPWCS